MTEPTLICPNCKTEIKLTENLAAPLLADTRRHYEKRIEQKDKDIAERERFVRDKEKLLADEKKLVDEEIASKVREQLKSDRTKIAAEEAKKAMLAAAGEIEQKDKQVAELEAVLKQRSAKLEEAQKSQADFLKKQRVLEDKERELELTVEKRIQESLDATREQAKKEAEEILQLKVKEKEQTIASMQKTIEELKRKSEQGSQQLQGEVQELELETLLSGKFPRDSIEPVPKGEHGGDILHRVNGSLGHLCGTILWESKRTKSWSDGWLAKLRDDQRMAKAEVAVIVSQVLPKGVETFELIDGVWIAHPRVILPLAVVLRQMLIDVTLAKKSTEGQQTKMEMVYHYLTGPQFRQRVQAIVETFSSMKEDIEKEKAVISKQWAKREKQIERVMQSTVGMYGDLQGIAGKTLQEIEGLEMKALDAPSSEEEGDVPF